MQPSAPPSPTSTYPVKLPTAKSRSIRKLYGNATNPARILIRLDPKSCGKVKYRDNNPLEALMKNAILFALVALSTPIAFAEENSMSCTLGDKVRKIEVKYTEAGKKTPCEVVYTKEGASEGKVIFTAKAEDGFCEKKAEEFSKKLAGMGFKCE